jgi:hypothetical protein
MGQFSFECCSQVQKVSSAIQYLPCFGSGLLLFLFTGISVLEVYFFAPPPFSRAGSVFHPPPPLFMFYYSSLFDFQFCGAAQI